jgi:hypothetical protein
VLSFVDEELVLDRGNVNVEDRGNLMTFGFTPESFDAGPVEQALVAVGERLGARFADVAGPRDVLCLVRRAGRPATVFGGLCRAE